MTRDKLIDEFIELKSADELERLQRDERSLRASIGVSEATLTGLESQLAEHRGRNNAGCALDEWRAAHAADEEQERK